MQDPDTYPIHYAAIPRDVAAAKPTNRAELRKIIQDATASFDDQIVTFDRSVDHMGLVIWGDFQVAVGSVEVEFDESDPLILYGKLIYRHNKPTTRAESDAIMNALCSTVSVSRLGPVANYIDIHDGHSDRAAGTPYFQCGFRVKCPA